MTELTKRKKEVALLLACGLTYDDISFKLKISKQTIKHHIEELNLMFNAFNRPHLIVLLLLDGALSLEELKPLINARPPQTLTTINRERRLQKEQRHVERAER